MLDKNTNKKNQHVLTTVGYIFSKYVHCDMRLLVVKNKCIAFFAIYTVFGFLSLETTRSAITCIAMPTKMLQNSLISSNSVTFQKVKCYLFH